MRLNRAVLDAAVVPVGKAYVFVWDGAVPGFGVRVNAGGSRAYVAQYRNASGTTKRLTLGRFDAMTIEEARKLARSEIARAVTGSDPAEEKARARARVTVTMGAVVSAYLKAVEPRLRPSTSEEAKRYLTKHFAALAPRPVNAIQRVEVATALREIAERNGPVAANRGRATLSALFAWAIGEGLAEANPVIGTNRHADERSRDHVLSDGEMTAVWRACGDDHFGRIVRLLILTGQRRDEVGDMAWSEIAGDVWTLPGTRTKNRRPHDVPLSPLALNILQGLPIRLGRDLVFGAREGGFSGWSKAKKDLDARIAETGFVMRPWRLHDLRRTTATGMARLGTLPHVVEAVLNHVSGARAGVAGIYNRHAYDAEKRIALEAWAERLRSLS